MEKPVAYRQPLMARGNNANIMRPQRPPPSQADINLMKLPLSDFTSEFVSIKDLEPGRKSNVIGVVAQFKPVSQAVFGKRDFYCTVTLCDRERGLAGTGLQCQFFNPKIEGVPAPSQTGEIVIAYNLYIKTRGCDIQGCSTEKTRIKHIGPGFDMASLTPKERELVKGLRDWWNTRGGAPGARGEIVKRDASGMVINEAGALYSRKLNTISNLVHREFYDLVVEVVNFYPNSPFELYVTDYTQNTQLFNYDWNKKKDTWRGPFGKRTLLIECWGETAEQASRCRIGQYYLIKNVRAKINSVGVLQGSMNPDRDYPNKMMFEILNTNLESVQTLCKLKDEYMKAFTESVSRSEELEAIAKRKAAEEFPSDDEAHPTKRQALHPKKPPLQTPPRKQNRTRPKTVEEELYTPRISEEIHSENGHVHPVSIAQILSTNTTNFQPRKMRIKCRVHSYSPANLADFVVAWCNNCNSTYPLSKFQAPSSLRGQSSDPLGGSWKLGSSPVCKKCLCPPPSSHYEDDSPFRWEFKLLLEDSQGNTLPVIVADEEAEDLLDLTPENLYENPAVLSQLREKMSILWGSPIDSTSNSTPPKSIRKRQRRNNKSRKAFQELRFSDDVSFDDDSCSSLDASYYAKQQDEDGAGRMGGKIVRVRDRVRVEEMRKGTWFFASLWEFWGRESEAAFGKRRWRLFGTRIVDDGRGIDV